MELPQSRPIGTEGKKPTHDFLSLYSHSSFQHQDPRPSQGSYPKTRNFLQPLEMVGKNSSNKGDSTVETSTVERPPPLQPPPPPPPPLVGHILPGGIGTYSISHISNFNQRIPKAESPVFAVIRASSGEDNSDINKANSNSNSCSGSSFTLWEESGVKEMGMRGKYTAGERQVTAEQAEKLGHWSTEGPLQAPFVHHNSFSSLPSTKQTSQKKQSFMEMMKPGKGLQEDEDDDEEEFVLNKGGSTQKELTVKVDGKSTDQKANTPRSKHSATEQRRRSKINDRFQILRDLIPQTDQKRDKASFLLEVIEYVQGLQEKVHKYETAYQGWSSEHTKSTPWRNSLGPGQSMVDHSRLPKNGPGQGLMFPGKFNDNNIGITSPMLAKAHNPVESDQSMDVAYKPMDHHTVIANKVVPLPIPLQPNLFKPVGRTGGLTQPLQIPISDGENTVCQPPHLWQNRACANETLNEKGEMTIEGGTISISSVYSHGLLNNLTQALQSSGVDLSQASISVQIDLGKQAISRLSSTTSSTKDHEDPSSSNRARAHSRVTSSGEDSDQARKRLKTEKS